MRPLALSTMHISAFSTAARACLALALVPALLAGCGGAAPPADASPSDELAGSGVGAASSAAPDAASFMRVGEITPVTLATASSPPPPPLVTKPKDGKENDELGGRKPDPKSPSDSRGSQSAGDPLAAAPTATPESKPQGHVEGAVVDSASALSEAEVRATIVQSQASFRTCYDLGSASAASAFQGTVALRASIGPSGVVASVDVVSSTTNNIRVDTCVADAVRRIQFPSKGGSAVIAFPIAFGR